MKRFGLIGKTLKHSFSKQFFTDKFRAENLEGYRYENFELGSIDELPSLLERNPDIIGLNITIPYKEEIIQFLDVKSDVVEATGACNCISIAEGKLHGYNTDVAGFKNSLQPKLEEQHKHALILGSGGASKAVQFALDKLNIDYLIVSRRKKDNQIGYEDIGADTLQERRLIINTTPLGMYPAVNDDPPIPYEYITPAHFLFDLIYNPPKTCFLQKGEQKGAKLANGHEMLILQAEESWRIWSELSK